MARTCCNRSRIIPRFSTRWSTARAAGPQALAYEHSYRAGRRIVTHWRKHEAKRPERNGERPTLRARRPSALLGLSPPSCSALCRASTPDDVEFYRSLEET